MKRITIKDIAKRLNVNPSTVSRALKDHPDIGPDLRSKIKKLAEELHYRPNQMAVQLRQRQSRLIGLIVPELTMFFYPSVLRGIQDVLHEPGYNLVMLPSNESPERELENISICAENGVAGILISFARQSQAISQTDFLHDLGVPIVIFDKVIAGMPFDAILLNDEEAAKMAVEKLIQTGCTRIGGIFGNPNLQMTHLRVAGFRKALQAAGLPFLENYITFSDDPLEAANCAESLMTQNPPPDGIFAMSDEIIIGAYPAIVRAGRKIPEECSVICISDGFLPYCLYPNISFVQHSGEEHGRLAAKKVLNLIESGDFINEEYVGEKILISPKLVELATTKK